MLPSIMNIDFFLFSHLNCFTNVTIYQDRRQTHGLAAVALKFGEWSVLQNFKLDVAHLFKLNFPSKVFSS